MKKRNTLVAATAALMIGSLVGCGSAGQSPEAKGTEAGGSTKESKVDSIAELLPEDVVKAGTLKVATAATAAPEGFKTEKGELDGYEIKLMEGIADVLGVKVDWQVTDFASLIPGLKSSRFSIGTGQIGITKERAQNVDFVTLVMTNQSFAALKSAGLKDITINDLCGKSVAVNQGSRQQEFGEAQSKVCVQNGKPAVNLNVYQSTNDAWLAIQSKRSEIYWSGATGVGYLVGKSDQAEVIGHHLEPYPTGIALDKDSPIGPAVQAALQHLIEDGTYEEILDKWGLKENAVAKSELNPAITW